MKVSYNWLQEYFPETLPSPEKLADLLTFHVFEIEGIEKLKNDAVLDVKVLPDRAHYALSHRGIAYEISAITVMAMQKRESGEERKKEEEKNASAQVLASDKKVAVHNTEPDFCLRYEARYIENIKVKSSPDWLKERLEALGQRSINNIVDATNYVMLDMNQPLHAFDADKVVGGISIRRAKIGEKITTLDGKEIILDESVLVIADDESPLAIAGVKGGSKAAVTEKTKNIILESANFQASGIRKTSQKVGIKNDSSKRFENEISPELTEKAMEEVSKLISDIAAPESMGQMTDVYPIKQKINTITISSEFISEMLGVQIPEKEIEDIFSRLYIECEKSNSGNNAQYILTIPAYRLDLKIPEDIVEEVGRIYGYEKIPAISLPATSFKPKVNKEFYYAHKIKNILAEMGYSEVITYSLRPKGEVEIENPLASDKNFLRSNLAESIEEALEFNLRNAELLGLDQIKIFEIGTVFTKNTEHTSLAVGVLNVKGRKGIKKEADERTAVLQVLAEKLGIKDMENKGKITKNVFELNLIALISELADVEKYDDTINDSEKSKKLEIIKYQPISVYPFAVRDIAVFVPDSVQEIELEKLIRENAGKLLVRLALFDVFKKEFPEGPKVSYAFRLVFQSHEKTLTEEEINAIMKSITEAMNEKEGWEVR